MIAEVHHVLWRRGLVCEEDRARDQHDALCIAAWMSRAYRDGSLAGFLKPQLAAAERTVAEGWILEVPSGIRLGKRGRSDQAPRANNRPRPAHATRGRDKTRELQISRCHLSRLRVGEIRALNDPRQRKRLTAQRVRSGRGRLPWLQARRW